MLFAVLILGDTSVPPLTMISCSLVVLIYRIFAAADSTDLFGKNFKS